MPRTDVTFNIHLSSTGFENIDAVTKKVKADINDIKGAFKGTNNNLKKVNVTLRDTDEVAKKHIKSLGFMAFQWGFIANRARDALRSVSRIVQSTVSEAAGAQDAMVRAVIASGLDLTSTSEKTAVAIQYMNDAMLTLGSGRTMFNIAEVATVTKEVGKAVKFVGTELEIAQQTMGAVTQVLNLMAIEEINAADAAQNIVKVSKMFNRSYEDVADVLVNVNRQSTAEIQNLIISFGAAGQQAILMGLTLEETGAMVGLVSDIIGQQGGRAGLALGQAFRDLRDPVVALSTSMKAMGVEIFDSTGKVRNFGQVLKEFKTAIVKIKKQHGELGVSAFVKSLKMDANAERAFLALINNIEILDELIEGASQKGTAKKQAEVITEKSLVALIKRMAGSIQSLKLAFTMGLAPVIQELQAILQSLAEDKEVQEFFFTLGEILKEDLLPILKEGGKFLKAIMKVLTKNKPLLKFVVSAILLIVGALAGLAIIGQFIVPMLVMGAALQFFGLTAMLAGTATILLVGGLAAIAVVSGFIIGWELAKWTHEVWEENVALRDAVTHLEIAWWSLIEGPFTKWNEEVAKSHEEGLKNMIDGWTKFWEEDFPTWLEEADMNWRSWINDLIIGYAEFKIKSAESWEKFKLDVNDAVVHAGIWLNKFFKKDVPKFFTEDLPKAITDAWNTIVNGGKIIGSAIWTGIKAMADDLWDIIEIIDEAIGFSDFVAKGEEWGKGLAEGIEKWFKEHFTIAALLGGLASLIPSMQPAYAEAGDLTGMIQSEELQARITLLSEMIDLLNNSFLTLLTSTDTLTYLINTLSLTSTTFNGRLTVVNATSTTFISSLTRLIAKLNHTSTLLYIMQVQIIGVNERLIKVQSAADELANAMRSLAARARSTTFSKSRGISGFASGGVITAPTLGLVGEAGPEAIIPLDRLSGIMNNLKGGNTSTVVNDINITIEGNASEGTVDDLIDRLSSLLGDSIRGKSMKRLAR